MNMCVPERGCRFVSGWIEYKKTLSTITTLTSTLLLLSLTL